MFNTNQWQLLQVAMDSVSARLDAVLARELNISSREFMMLRTLSTQFEGDGGHFRMKALALAVGLSPSATTRLMNRLEERGFLVRYICATDRRGIYSDVSAAGLEILKKAEELAEEAIHHSNLEISSETVKLVDDDGFTLDYSTIAKQ